MNPDKELVELLKKGDEIAFTELINKYNRKLFSYAVSLSGDYSLAKDIVQEVFIKTFEYFSYELLWLIAITALLDIFS